MATATLRPRVALNPPLRPGYRTRTQLLPWPSDPSLQHLLVPTHIPDARLPPRILRDLPPPALSPPCPPPADEHKQSAMAQGAPKKTTKTAMQSRANKPQQAKKGARVAKSKKSTAADKLQRRLAAGIVNKTERLLGERAGHLELIGPGKKARGQNKDDKDAKATKGGSRKFG
ncbi:hypothetical protein F5Y18DRAFT_444388 [Xylariaceae sp. FL1019]|nr:hypothetical protein F5Y18DRAFT_444388 [Xylariaceae sp. FL1019]